MSTQPSIIQRPLSPSSSSSPSHPTQYSNYIVPPATLRIQPIRSISYDSSHLLKNELASSISPTALGASGALRKDSIASLSSQPLSPVLSSYRSLQELPAGSRISQVRSASPRLVSQRMQRDSVAEHSSGLLVTSVHLSTPTKPREPQPTTPSPHRPTSQMSYSTSSLLSSPPVFRGYDPSNDTNVTGSTHYTNSLFERAGSVMSDWSHGSLVRAFQQDSDSSSDFEIDDEEDDDSYDITRGFNQFSQNQFGGRPQNENPTIISIPLNGRKDNAIDDSEEESNANSNSPNPRHSLMISPLENPRHFQLAETNTSGSLNSSSTFVNQNRLLDTPERNTDNEDSIVSRDTPSTRGIFTTTSIDNMSLTAPLRPSQPISSETLHENLDQSYKRSSKGFLDSLPNLPVLPNNNTRQRKSEDSLGDGLARANLTQSVVAAANAPLGPPFTGSELGDYNRVQKRGRAVNHQPKRSYSILDPSDHLHSLYVQEVLLRGNEDESEHADEESLDAVARQKQYDGLGNSAEQNKSSSGDEQKKMQRKFSQRIMDKLRPKSRNELHNPDFELKTMPKKGAETLISQPYDQNLGEARAITTNSNQQNTTNSMVSKGRVSQPDSGRNNQLDSLGTSGLETPRGAGNSNANASLSGRISDQNYNSNNQQVFSFVPPHNPFATLGNSPSGSVFTSASLYTHSSSSSFPISTAQSQSHPTPGNQQDSPSSCTAPEISSLTSSPSQLPSTHSPSDSQQPPVMSANDRYYPNCPNGQHGYNQYSQYNDPSDRSNNVYASAPGYPLHQHSQHEDSTSSGTVSAPAVAFPASAVAAHQPPSNGFHSYDEKFTESSVSQTHPYASGDPPGGDPYSSKEVGSAPKKPNRKLWLWLGIAALVVILVAVLVPVGVLVIGKNNKTHQANVTSPTLLSSGGNNGSSSTSPAFSPSTTATLPDQFKGTIYDISTWLNTTDFNTTFTDVTVGGLPIMGLNTSYDNSAQPNQFVPPISQGFDYNTLPIRGVNLGGWLVLEPFLTPSFFDKYNLSLGIVDEYTLTTYVNTTQGFTAIKDLLENHYASFVTEDTFREISEAGLDHVRIPFGYWAVRVWPGDNFLPQVSWRYLLRGIEWARKYGLRVNIDLHSVPGGQNGWNHSGRQGVLDWLNGPDGELNGNRTLEIHQQLATFFAQERYDNLVTIYGLVNEPRMTTLNVTVVDAWTRSAYHLVENCGYNGTIVYGDGFLGVDAWKGVFPEDEFPNLMLDVHEYTIFDPSLISMPHAGKVNYVCINWKDDLIRSSNPATGHGLTFVGEWSQADTDCTPMLNNVGVGARWDGTFNPGPGGADPVLTPHCPTMDSQCSCALPSSASVGNYSAEYKTFLLDFAEAQMEVYETAAKGFMYWSWDTETYNAAQWSYKKGREIGIIPQLAYQRAYNCSQGTPNYDILGLPEFY